MNVAQPPDVSFSVRDTLRQIGGEGHILHQAVRALDILSASGTGLGEVLQDYARQASRQLRELTHAARQALAGTGGYEEAQALAAVGMTLRTVRSVLGMAPSAMKRNKADAIGEQERLTRDEILRLADEFARSPELAPLLLSEDSGQLFAALIAPHVPPQEQPAASAL